MKTVVYTISNLRRSGPTLVLYGLIKNLDRSCFTPIVFTLSDEKDNSIKPAFEKMGVKIYCLHKSGIATFLSGAWQFRRLINQLKPDIIHANGFRDILLTAFAAPKMYQKYATIHCDWAVDYCLKYGKFIGKISSSLQTIALRKVNVRVACSEILADLLNKKYPNMYFNFVNNGVDTDIFQPVLDKMLLRKKLGLPQDKKIIIWAGSFTPRKNPLDMARSILKLPEKQYFFVFCGARGPLLSSCKELLKNRKDVLFTGYITNIEQYYQAADIYVSTSRSEGLPLAVLEAQFCGLVPLLSDIPQHLYIVQAEIGTSCLFGAEEELLCKLTALLTTNNNSLLAACQAYIQRFSAKYMAEQYMRVYQQTMQGTSHA